jgi:hypothetical protein
MKLSLDSGDSIDAWNTFGNKKDNGGNLRVTKIIWIREEHNAT